jgi:hypothetical protein
MAPIILFDADVTVHDADVTVHDANVTVQLEELSSVLDKQKNRKYRE